MKAPTEDIPGGSSYIIWNINPIDNRNLKQKYEGESSNFFEVVAITLQLLLYRSA